MPASGSLERNAKAHFDEPLDTLIPRLIEEEGSIYRAANRLGVTPNAIQNWLKNKNLRVETWQSAKVVEVEHA